MIEIEELVELKELEKEEQEKLFKLSGFSQRKTFEKHNEVIKFTSIRKKCRRDSLRYKAYEKIPSNIITGEIIGEIIFPSGKYGGVCHSWGKRRVTVIDIELNRLS